MGIDERLEQCLAEPNAFQELRTLIETLLAEGQTQPMILKLFETTRRHLREVGREGDEDALMEAMDFLIGWCSSHMDLSGPRPALTPNPVDQSVVENPGA